MSMSGQSISTMQSNKFVYTQGDIDEPLLDPGLVKRTLNPVCEKIDVRKYTNINRNKCFEYMETYCIEKLEASGLSNTACAYPMDRQFECVSDTDCGNQVVCVKGKCVECAVNSDCPDKFLCQGNNKCTFDVNSEYRNIGNGYCRSNSGISSQTITRITLSRKVSAVDCGDKCRVYTDLFGFVTDGISCKCYRHTGSRMTTPFPVRLTPAFHGSVSPCYVVKNKNCGYYTCSKQYKSTCTAVPKCPAGYSFLRDDNGPCWWPTTRIVCQKWEKCTRC